jgi:hypothetical protein
MGAVDSIEAAAEASGRRVHKVALPEQFRCGGSASYVRGVEQLLGISDDEPEPWDGDERFELLQADSPLEMEQLLRRKEADGYTARMSAGYCWPWSDP